MSPADVRYAAACAILMSKLVAVGPKVYDLPDSSRDRYLQRLEDEAVDSAKRLYTLTR